MPCETLLDRVRAGREGAGANRVRIFVRNLRRKLGDDAASPGTSSASAASATACPIRARHERRCAGRDPADACSPAIRAEPDAVPVGSQGRLMGPGFEPDAREPDADGAPGVRGGAKPSGYRLRSSFIRSRAMCGGWLRRASRFRHVPATW